VCVGGGERESERASERRERERAVITTKLYNEAWGSSNPPTSHSAIVKAELRGGLLSTGD